MGSKKRSRLPQRVQVQADHLAPNGDGVGEVEGFALHVSGLLPGERAEVEIVHVGKQSRRAHGRLVAVLEASPHRREPPCRHQNRCSGCPLMQATESGRGELILQRLASLGLEVDALVTGEHALGYRWSAKRVVGGAAGALRLGSYRRGSHELADMDGCLVDHPDLVSAASEIREQGSRLGIEPYDEGEGTGDLRYVWLKTNGEHEVLVTLISASAESRAPELAAALERPTGVAWAHQPSGGNAMRGSDVRVLRGSAAIGLELVGRRVEVGPLGFLQPNPSVAARAYVDLVEGGQAPNGGLAFDLYAGAGITTAMLADRHQEVRACEAHPESAAALGVAPQTAAAFLADQAAARPGFVVANPPRAGLGAEVCDQLVAMAARAPFHLHIMSCDPVALVRDLERLTAGGFVLGGARAYDTLPQTAHVEVIAWLSPPAAAPA